MKCHECGGNMSRVVTSVNSKWGDRQVEVEGVEAWECEECGERLFERREVDMLQNIAQGSVEGKQ